MKQSTSAKILSWTAGLVALIAVIFTTAAFAALQSQPGVLRGNTIQTAVASLQVSANGTTFGSTIDGYAFSNLLPGGAPSPTNGYPVYVKNVGTSPLALKLSVAGTVSNPDNVDLSKVHVIISPLTGAGQNLTLQDLIAANTTGGISINQASHIIPSQIASFTIQISLDADAMTGPSATLSNIDFNFGALAVN